MKINIYYRHAEGCKDGYFRPEGFSFERCLKNFLESIDGAKDVNLTLVFDGNIENDFIKNYTMYFDNVINTEYRNSLKSFLHLLDYIENQDMDEHDIIYYVENDYLHVKGWLDKVRALFSTYNGIDYVSLYDHNDKYTEPQYANLLARLITTHNSHWRNTPSTCGTYMMLRSTWEKDIDIWKAATGDHETFMKLNNERQRSLLTPIPGLNTHCMKTLESPTIDWSTI